MKKQYVLSILATFLLLFMGFFANAQTLPTADSGNIERVFTYDELVGGVKSEPKKTAQIKDTDSLVFTLAFTKNLKRGMQDPDVKRLKEFLFPWVAATEVFDLATEQAVGGFQLEYGVVSSDTSDGYGQFGPKTRAKMLEVLINTRTATARSDSIAADRIAQAASAAAKKPIVKKAETAAKDNEETQSDGGWFNRAVQFFGTSAIDLTIVLVILSLSLLGIFIFWFVGRRRKIKARRTETIKTVSGVSEEKALVAVPAIQPPSAKASAKTAAKEEKKVGWFMWFFGKIFHAIEHYFTHGISLFFIINDELNKLELETDLEKRYKKARKLCKEYIISLAVTSIILIVLVFGPSWIGIVSKLTEFIPIYVSFEGEELNLAVVVCYVLTALLILFWVITLCFGWRSPSPGHKTWVRINGHFAFPKKASSAGILTFPIGKLISLWKCPTLIEVGCILSEESDPFITTHIMTASGKTAVFDNGTRGDEEKKRFAEDILYKNHLMMSRADFLAIVEAEEDEENGKKFFNKYGDGVERFQEDLKFICASAREEVCGMKSGAQITGSLGNIKSKIAAVIKRELDKLDCGYKVAIFLMAGLDFSCEIEREGDNSGLIKRGIESLDIPVSAAAPATTS